MLTSSALVLFMTTPGLAMFYGGLVRKKNVVSVLMQCIFLMGLMTVLWATVGYTLAFGGDKQYLDKTSGKLVTPTPDAWIGNMDYLFMDGVKAEWTGSGSVIPLHTTLNVPRLTHMLFQGMFFIITPALICGAFAERMKFSAMVAYSILWGLIVYCPLCHWVWGGGIFQYGTVHAGQWCARRCARFRRRHGRPHQFRRFGADMLPGARQALGFSQRADAAAQPDVYGPGRRHVVGGVVRL